LRRIVDPVLRGSIVGRSRDPEQVGCHGRREHGRASSEDTIDDRCWAVLQRTEGAHGHVDFDRPLLDPQLAKRAFDLADTDDSV
jgi:hypothetical protein